MKLGIIGAMDVEVATLKENMENKTETVIAGSVYVEGILEGLPVVVVQCGVGKVNAALCVQVLCDCFDVTHKDTYFGQKTWEQGEKRMQQLALQTLAKKTGIRQSEFGAVFSGDLLNQCIGSSFTLRNTGIPHLGLYGACSTMAESLLMASMAVGGGFRDQVVAMTSSHFASSERQYRFPLGYGGQRTPTAQWTVTGAGAALLCTEGKGPFPWNRCDV